jgi:predicted MFS family arabinose efflux permease
MTLRVLLGVAESIVAPAIIRWMRCQFTKTDIGPAIAAPLAAWATMLCGWRSIFMLLGLGGTVWLISWLLLVRDGAPQFCAGSPRKPESRLCHLDESR